MKETQNREELEQIANRLVAPEKGILAADESRSTAGKRLARINLDNNRENRRRYRQLFLTSNGYGKGISGVILFRETLTQTDDDGKPFLDYLHEEDVLPGVKVDRGRSELPGFPGEAFTEGLDGMRERLKKFRDQGAKFTKFRSVINIDDQKPSEQAVEANARIQALYAGISQELNLVPVVEPEVLLQGDHSIQTAESVTSRTLEKVFDELNKYRVFLSGMLLKSSMVLPGPDHPEQTGPEEVAKATLRCLHRSVPDEVPGVVFLSGGQSPEEATKNLGAINRLANSAPWELSFSFGRALQGPSLEAWNGEPDNRHRAQELFLERVRETKKGRTG